MTVTDGQWFYGCKQFQFWTANILHQMCKEKLHLACYGNMSEQLQSIWTCLSLVECTQFSVVHPTQSIWVEKTCLNHVEPLSTIKELFFATIAMQTASNPCLNPSWITSDTTPQWGQNINLTCRHNSHRIMKWDWNWDLEWVSTAWEPLTVILWHI